MWENIYLIAVFLSGIALIGIVVVVCIEKTKEMREKNDSREKKIMEAWEEKK